MARQTNPETFPGDLKAIWTLNQHHILNGCFRQGRRADIVPDIADLEEYATVEATEGLSITIRPDAIGKIVLGDYGVASFPHWYQGILAPTVKHVAQDFIFYAQRLEEQAGEVVAVAAGDTICCLVEDFSRVSLVSLVEQNLRSAA